MTPLNTFRTRIGSAPRVLPDVLGERPDWACEGDRVEQIWQHQSAALRDGEPTLGWIVMANEALWVGTPGLVAPAQVVYSFDPALRGNPERLDPIARAVHGFYDPNREQSPRERPWLRSLQDQLGSGYERSFHERVPRSLTFGWVVYHATVVLIADQLPSGRLQSSALPLLVQRQPGGVAIVPPAEFWPTT